MRQRGEDAVGARAEAHPLDGGGAVADGRGHLAARQGQFDRAAGVPGGHRGQDDLGAGRALGAEAAADVLGDDGDLARVDPEQRGEVFADLGGALAGVVDGQMAVRPPGGGGVRLHRVVVQRGQV